LRHLRHLVSAIVLIRLAISHFIALFLEISWASRSSNIPRAHHLIIGELRVDVIVSARWLGWWLDYWGWALDWICCRCSDGAEGIWLGIPYTVA
jgi:hypothetical protein